MFPDFYASEITFHRSAKHCSEIHMIPFSFVSLSKNANKINPNHASVWFQQSSNSAVVSRYGFAFSLWLNSVNLSMSPIRITVKRMNMKVMGKRNENEGWVSLRILSRKVSTWSASVSVKLHPQWWWLIKFSHAQQIMLIGRNILQLNSQLTCTDSIVNRVSYAACEHSSSGELWLILQMHILFTCSDRWWRTASTNRNGWMSDVKE